LEEEDFGDSELKRKRRSPT